MWVPYIAFQSLFLILTQSKKYVIVEKGVNAKTYTWIFIAAFFIISKIWMAQRYWMNRQTAVHPYNILFSSIKNSYQPWKDMKELKVILVSEKSQSENVIYHMSPTIWHSVKGKSIGTIIKSLVVKGWGKREINRQNRRFSQQWNYSYYIIMMHIYHYIFGQTQRTYNTKWTLR